MAKPKAIITRRWPERVEKRAAELFDATFNERDAPLTTEQLRTAMRTADVLMPTVTDAVTAEIIAAAGRRARMIGNFGVGFNNIDIDAAKAAGVVVTNTPEVLTDCTADIALILLLSVARRTSEGERHLRSGEWTGWRPTHMLGRKVTDKSLALIGFGRIGQALAGKARHGLRMEISFYDPYFGGEPPLAATRYDDLGEMLAAADFVSVHCPATEETRGFINREIFSVMKPSAFLINTARGDVVNEDDLIAALRRGQIAGAGLDVYVGEPKVDPRLLAMENVVLLPHLGSASLETREAMGMRVLENAEAFFNGKPPRDRVV